MKHLTMGAFALALALGTVCAGAQSLDDLNIQIHGYATQGFLYSTHNNFFTTNSTDGSAGWTEAVVNITAQPDPKLRIGVQGRYYLLGSYGNEITLDWAAADYKYNDRIGVRFGKVKTPIGLLNEVQDIDPAYTWVILPQSIYPLPSRNSILSHYGGVVYGSLRLGDAYGKLDYSAYGGQRVLSGTDGYFADFRSAGFVLPGNVTGPAFGGNLKWRLPAKGILVGMSVTSDNISGAATYGPYSGTLSLSKRIYRPWVYGKYELGKYMLAAEWNHFTPAVAITLTGLPAPIVTPFDEQQYYAMGTYKPTGKLTLGSYFSSDINKAAPLSTARYEKDWAITGRYDFNTFLYAKAEQHFIKGTFDNIDGSDNADPKPQSKMTLFKVGVSF